MDQDTCACCGDRDGEGRAATRRVYMFSRFNGEPDHRRSVVMCEGCISTMPFDLSALVEHMDMARSPQAADEALLEGFISRYLSELWPEDTPPSYMQLCKVLNAVGIRAPRGGRWEYHNLQQRMGRMDIDREAIASERAKRSYADRMADLVARAAEYTASVYAQAGAGPLEREWGPPGPAALPADMPGQEEGSRA